MALQPLRVGVSFCALALLLVLTAAGCSAGGDGTAVSPPADATADEGPGVTASPAGHRPDALLGIMWKDDTASLTPIAPRSLRPLGTKRIALGQTPGSWSFSPGGSQLVLATAEDPARLRIIDVERMRALGQIELGRGSVETIAWLAPSRLVAAVETPDPGLLLATVDIGEHRVLSRRPVDGQVIDSGRLSDRLVLLLSPRGKIGPAQLATIDAQGRVQATTLQRVHAGIEANEDSDVAIGRGRGPGLAINQELRRAYVVGAGEPVAEVDLDGLRVSYHDLATPISLLDRLRNWLEPTAEAKGVSGPFRHARWIGNGVIAVSGYNDESYVDASGAWHYESTPAGLTLIDTREWSVESVDQQTNSFWYVAGTLVVLNHDGSIRGYSVDGTATFAFPNLDPLGFVLTADRYAYVPRMDNSVAVIDVRSGAVILPRVKTGVQSVLAGDVADF
jgi:hypothetical protein